MQGFKTHDNTIVSNTTCLSTATTTALLLLLLLLLLPPPASNRHPLSQAKRMQCVSGLDCLRPGMTRRVHQGGLALSQTTKDTPPIRRSAPLAGINFGFMLNACYIVYTLCIPNSIEHHTSSNNRAGKTLRSECRDCDGESEC